MVCYRRRKPSRQGLFSTSRQYKGPWLSLSEHSQSPDIYANLASRSLLQGWISTSPSTRTGTDPESKGEELSQYLSSRSVSELSEAHHKELVPAIELDCMPVTFVAIDTLAEFIFGEERHKLCEDCFTLVHGLRETAQMPARKLTSSIRKIIFAL